MTTASQPRRIGAADSKTRAQLLDAAEQLLLDEGYAAVTSRQVGAKAGLKPQLVHYYFRTMDDLFLEVFRRRADENLAHFERTVAADNSLRTLWRLNADPRGAALLTNWRDDEARLGGCGGTGPQGADRLPVRAREAVFAVAQVMFRAECLH